MPTPSLGMVLIIPYNSSPLDCISDAIQSINKHKKSSTGK